jgi:hypothetical protein
MNKKIFTFLIFVLIINIDLISADNDKNNAFRSSQTKYLSSLLGRLYELHAEKEEYLQLARRSDIQIIEDRVVVTISAKPGTTTEDMNTNNLRAFGARVQAKARHSMRVEIPISELVNVATEFKDFADIRLPITPVEHAVTSEGVTLMNANSWQDWGYDGSGVKVAVIDGGFDSLTEAQAKGDIPLTYKSFDFTGGGLETTTPHGTAVAEAIFDLAPQAEFYLYKISDNTDLENARDSCISNGVDIVNHSMGWFNALGYYDGTGFICSIVDSALSYGIIWINSAGNSARHHYRAIFQDNGHNHHIFNEPDDTINPTGPYSAGQYIKICMNWDKYIYTDQDYDLYLAKDTGNVTPKWILVDSSTNRQTGGSTIQDIPQEIITFENSEDDVMYGILVKKLPTTSEDVDFTLFSLEQRGLSYYTESSSLPDPGTVTDVVTVGAINKDNYTSGPQEFFSSQGPTNDGRIKPDVSAPDNCDSYTYKHWYGTSLSSPHTAGICALIKSRFPSFNETDTREYLYNNCTADLGTSGRDNIYGWGKVVMPDISLEVTSPDGGENWYIDGTNNITWSSSGTSGGVKIEYSTDNGMSWSYVIASVPDTGTYPWVVPNTPSDSCLVRITDTTGSPSDTSDAMFEISYPTPNITITSPNGGETWYIDSMYDITWTTNFTTESVKIEYSTNYGMDWSEVIASIKADTLAYAWMIPNTPSDSCLVRITDTVGTPSDTSDATFIISPGTSVPHSKSPSVYSMIVKGVTADAQFEVKYGLPEKANVRFGVYDIKGTKIKEILEEHTPGFYSTKIDIIDKPVGVYFIRMEANNKKFTKTRKVILVR